MKIEIIFNVFEKLLYAESQKWISLKNLIKSNNIILKLKRNYNPTILFRGEVQFLAHIFSCVDHI